MKNMYRRVIVGRNRQKLEGVSDILWPEVWDILWGTVCIMAWHRVGNPVQTWVMTDEWGWRTL